MPYNFPWPAIMCRIVIVFLCCIVVLSLDLLHRSMLHVFPSHGDELSWNHRIRSHGGISFAGWYLCIYSLFKYSLTVSLCLECDFYRIWYKRKAKERDKVIDALVSIQISIIKSRVCPNTFYRPYIVTRCLNDNGDDDNVRVVVCSLKF